ncbi:two-component system NtrC family sensor kinase [Desulfobotulus alkaliphilus]|uniref:histidine kinase n=1 Tax=Desulfobotulus alkaliphilus TaxID=622671 RepID=A0A562RYJ3_9BACT|nr:sensor histidine kinase [Desulfobotulus alkaliphilus]TWI74169.1 two-component system NtrC family sensor kinase [Desulfobotulus alkaliphilus]
MKKTKPDTLSFIPFPSAHGEAIKPHDAYARLARRMVITSLFISLAPLLLVLAITLNRYDSTTREKIYNNLSAVVEHNRAEIDAFLKEKTSNLQSLILFSPPEVLQEPGVMESHLRRLRRVYGPVFEDIGLVSATTGILTSYAGPFRLGAADYSQAEWYLEFLQSNQTHAVSDVFLGLRGMPHFIIMVKAIDNNGKPWILRATIDFESFNTIVRNLRIGERGFVTILNRQGELQTRPLQDISPHTEVYQKLLNSPSGDALIFHQAKDKNGHNQIYVAGFLKNGEWMLISQQPESDAFSDLIRTRKMGIFLFMGCTLVIAFLATRFSRQLVHALQRKEAEKQMMNRQVIETGKLASIGELASGIAHEINNPVAIMVEEAGWIDDLLAEENPDQIKNMDEFRTSLNQIRTQGQRCKEITRKLLTFARKSESSNEALLINDMIREVLPLCEPRARYAQVSIETRLAPDLHRVMASRTEVQQVILNLANNAIDAMENEGGSLSFETVNHDDFLEILITDTGPGIPEANLKRIFDPFFTTKPVGKGTGLGLSICYGIIATMGGKLEVESMMGAGTTFRILLPAIREINVDEENSFHES